MSNYLQVFLAPRMLGGLAVVLVLAGLVTWWRRGHSRGWRRLGLFGFLATGGVVLLATLLRDPPTGPCPSCLADWQLEKLTAGAVGTDVALNVALFVPPVLLATLRWRAPVRTALIAAAGSLVIEVAQPLLGVGANDVVDLVANTAGAVLGALAGAGLLLAIDAATHRRIGLGRTTTVAIAAALTAALLVGYPAWVAGQRQAAAAAELETMFTGTTLSDYQAHRDGAWDSKLAAFSTADGPLTEMGYRTETIARERFTWTIWFATRCVVAQWTPTGFATLQDAGNNCTSDFHP